MNYLMALTLFVSLQKGITNNFIQNSASSSSSTPTLNDNNQQNNQNYHSSECGIRPAKRQPRKEQQPKYQYHQQHNNNNNQHNYYHYHHRNLYNNQHEQLQQHQQQNQQHIQEHQKQQKQKRQQHANNQFFHNARIPKIIAGSPTKQGQFPWQASLELLHPSMGFLGHWCGGVLVDEFWVLSASHCVHNDLFNLPLPPLWTVVLGEYDRNVESGYEQRIPVEKIILHQSYQHFLHDLVLMKLSMPADLSKFTNVRKICLPFIFNENDQSFNDDADDDGEEKETIMMQMTNTFNNNNNNSNNNKEDENFFPSLEDFLLSMQGRNKINFTLPSMKELMTTKIVNFLKRPIKRPSGRRNSKFPKRRNDKFMTRFKNFNIGDSSNSAANDGSGGSTDSLDLNNNNKNDDEIDGGADSSVAGKIGFIISKFNKDYHNDEYKDLPYTDCIATGWGKSNLTSDLSDTLLKTMVPLQSNSRCKDAYGSFVKIHKGHLCAGKLNGKGGTCVGDSGGPLQCRLTKNGPWILAGITSFGSGCALEGYPDVYTRTSFYMKWIRDIIENE